MQWNYGFDFGADTLRMVSVGRKGVYSEPQYAAFRSGEEIPFAWGDKAYELLARPMPGVRVERAVSEGIPEDTGLAAAWIKRIVSAGEKRVLIRRHALVAVSPALNRYAAQELLTEMIAQGIDTAGLVGLDACALLGAGVNISRSEGQFLLDIGSSAVHFSAFAYGKRTLCFRMPYGIGSAEKDIIGEIRQKEGVIISEGVAKVLKHGAFSRELSKMTLPAFDPTIMLPLERQFDPAYARDCVNRIIADIIRFCRQSTQDLSPQLAADYLKNGIVISGGGANIDGMAEGMSAALGVPAVCAAEPENAAARGLKQLLSDEDKAANLVFCAKEAEEQL